MIDTKERTSQTIVLEPEVLPPEGAEPQPQEVAEPHFTVGKVAFCLAAGWVGFNLVLHALNYFFGGVLRGNDDQREN